MNQRFAAPAHIAPRRRAPRAFAALLIAVCLLATPLVALAKKGEKNYKRGLEFEAAQQWDRAAQEFALAVATLPSDIEYQLHYRRSIFNASQKFMEQGRTLAERGDYTGAYNAFRQAYGYDPVNELAVSEMERMLRLQRQKEGLDANDSPTTNGDNNRVPRATSSSSSSNSARVIAVSAQEAALPVRSEPLRVINYNGDLESFIRQLANELNLNVIFDNTFSAQKKTINLNLRDVTTSKALDFIFLSQGLFFQKLDRRTILVADQSKRGQYQQLVLRTFYLQNIDPNDVRSLVSAALPPNSGRTPNITSNKATNSITVRDTPENIRLIEELIQAIDKDRAEVVMEVNIYEVSRTNLLQLGNQIGVEPTSGAPNQLTNLGGVSRSLAILVGSREVAQQAVGTAASTALGAAFILPTTALSAFQSKDNTRLLASTQVHAFDTEQSTTRIGQKVPVQTAQLSNFGFNGNTSSGGGVNPGLNGFGGGFPVIQYQDTGLILKFTPQVFPNLDVQVKMEIESNDVIGASTALTPTFSQRNVTGMARIPNNRTMMIASVMQDRRSDGRRGLPLLGLIPVLGRLFSTPTKNDTNSDIVITVTPRVLRAPAVTPDDLEQRPSGTLQAPTAESLEAMLVVADREDQLAAARRLPTNPVVQLPAATESASAAAAAIDPPPAFVPAPKQLAGAGTTNSAPTETINAANVVNVNRSNDRQALPANTTTPANAFAPGANAPTSPAPNAAAPPLADNAHAAAPLLLPVSLPNAQLAIKPTMAALETATASARTETTATPAATSAATINTTAAISVADSPVLFVMANSGNMRVGEKQRLFVLIKTGVPLDLAAATLHFDPRVLAVRSVTLGNMFANTTQAQPSLTQTVDPLGSFVAALAPAAGTQINGMGVLLFVEVEAIGAGESEVGFQAAGVHLLASSSGRTLQPQLSPARLSVSAK